MSPHQHGEVYVTDDGSETDLDLGHYERFTHAPLTRDSNHTTGKIYLSVIEKERSGKFYEGKTVQVIPHVTDEIKSAIHTLARDDVDVVITEIGGTVGDIEGPAVSGGDPPVCARCRPRELPVHPPHAGTLPEGRRRAQDQADAAFRRDAAQIGIQPDVLDLPDRASDSRRRKRQDRALLQRRAQGGHRRARQAVQHL